MPFLDMTPRRLARIAALAVLLASGGWTGVAARAADTSNGGCSPAALAGAGEAVSVAIGAAGGGDTLRAGETSEIAWDATAPDCKGAAYLVIALPERVRLSGEGFVALAPGEPGPFGIDHAIDRLRLFVPLHLAEARRGVARVTPYVGGELAATWALAAPGAEALPVGERSLPVATGRPKIVIQDTFDVEIPRETLASADGEYVLAVFDGHFRVTDGRTGALVLAAEGYLPAFSPTARFLHWFGDLGSQLRVLDLFSETMVLDLDPAGLGGRGTFVQGVQWSPGDSFMLVSYEGEGALGFLETLSGRGYRYLANGCGACSPLETGVVDVELENTMVRLGAYEPDVAWSLAFDRKLVDDVVSDRPFVSADAAAHVVSPRPTLGSAGRGHATWRINGAPVSSLPPLDGAPIVLGGARAALLAEAETDDAPGAAAADGAAGDEETLSRAAMRLRPVERLNRADRMADALASLGINYRRPAPLAFDRVTFDSMADDADDDALYKVSSGTAALRRGLADAALAARFDEAAARLTEGSEDSETYDACNTVSRTEKAQVWSFRLDGRLHQIIQYFCYIGTGQFPEGAAFLLAERGDTVEITLLGETLDGDLPYLYGTADDDGFEDDAALDEEEPAERRAELVDMAFYDELRVFRPGDRHVALLNSRGELALVDVAAVTATFRHEGLEAQANISELAFSQDGRHLVQLNDDGRFYVHALATGDTAVAGRFVDDEVVAYGSGYRFDATPDGARHVHLKFPGDRNLYELAQFAGALREAGFARERLRAPSAPDAEPPGTPPRLSLDAEPTGGAARLRLRVRAQGEAELSRLAIYRDGRAIETVALSGHAAAIEKTVDLLPETRSISARVVDVRGLTSLTEDVAVSPPASMAPRGKLFVLAVGTDRYEDAAISDLRHAVSDARRFADAATAAASRSPYYAAAQGEVIADAAGLARLLPDRLAALGAQMGPQDTLFLHIAGHGLVDGGRFRLADRGTRLDRLDDTALGMDDLAAALEGLPGRIFVFLDACHSGAAGAATNDEAVEGLLAASAAPIAVLSASKGRQFSLEGAAFGGGAFTTALSEILAAGETLDRNGNGVLDFDELYGELKRRVVTETRGRQTPWIARSGLTGTIPVF